MHRLSRRLDRIEEGQIVKEKKDEHSVKLMLRILEARAGIGTIIRPEEATEENALKLLREPRVDNGPDLVQRILEGRRCLSRSG